MPGLHVRSKLIKGKTAMVCVPAVDVCLADRHDDHDSLTKTRERQLTDFFSAQP